MLYSDKTYWAARSEKPKPGKYRRGANLKGSGIVYLHSVMMKKPGPHYLFRPRKLRYVEVKGGRMYRVGYYGDRDGS